MCRMHTISRYMKYTISIKSCDNKESHLARHFNMRSNVYMACYYSNNVQVDPSGLERHIRDL